MNRIKVRGLICNLHGGMNASSQLQPCNFQKRRSRLRSKHGILVSLYDCSCALMYFSTPVLCAAEQNMLFSSETSSGKKQNCSQPLLQPWSRKKILKTVFFSPPFPTLCLLYMMHKDSGVWSLFKDKRLSWQQHLKCHVSLCLHSDESALQIWMEKNRLSDLWIVAAALNVLGAQAHRQDRRLLNAAGLWQSDAESARDDRNILTLCHRDRRWNKA